MARKILEEEYRGIGDMRPWPVYTWSIGDIVLSRTVVFSRARACVEHTDGSPHYFVEMEKGALR
jgi:hypothetical protein|tara:strand:- start:336 stop:527 length:192 start_codon:yes stop_codon:yes gene_type:complete